MSNAEEPKGQQESNRVSQSVGARGKVFRDPVHDLIRIEPEDSFILGLINTPEFQRLRRIRQLGVSSFTYPGAEHSRFSHSLGVMNFAQRILASLQARYRNSTEASALLKENSSVVKAAALLHDIGHGPFSHMMERAFRSFADHEKKTIELIKSDASQIASILTDNRINPQAVCDVINKTAQPRLAVDIVSSQLDADRMDYILRDALCTGVKYGTFDAEWVINSLCIGGEPGKVPSEIGPLDWRLCLEEKRGLPSAEQLVMARMHMSYQVYYHRATRAWEAHVLCLLTLASELAKAGKLPSGAPPHVEKFLSTAGRLDPEEWLWFDESAMHTALQAWSRNGAGESQELAALCRAFLLRTKMFACSDLGTPTTSQSIKLASGLAKAGRENIDWLLDDPKFTSYRDYGAGFRGSPKEQEKEAISTSAILISDGALQSASRPAEAVSEVLTALGEHPTGTRGSLCRLFYRTEIEENVRKMLADLGLIK